ncbi:hypothetical protein GSI_13242 [Ganoderma sinense ZZ0214-1]|uniref:Uncharacterized protein n=1 Tax=Ganoderma sinense ZZ0214-1 TaxID=1077348 RepID=A0A2G8RV22_9APHY|nr:hypothetical protein GSI_13242 [Ganoderma sinense ZZ0214-1]
MSCILKPTMPTSCSSELFVACPTMINVREWLTIHHKTASNSDCGAHKHHVFAVAEYPIFGSKHEFINTNIGIPLGPLSVEFAGQIDIRECGPRFDQVTVNVKYPLLASVKAGTYKGDLHCGCGINMAIGVPEIYGTLRLWVQGGDAFHPHAWLWVEFDLHVFDVEYKGKFAVLPIPRWLTFPSPDKLIEPASNPKAIAPIASPSISVHNETNNITNLVAPTVAVAAAVPESE